VAKKACRKQRNVLLVENGGVLYGTTINAFRGGREAAHFTTERHT
jgi:hypothetical protein